MKKADILSILLYTFISRAIIVGINLPESLCIIGILSYRFLCNYKKNKNLSDEILEKVNKDIEQHKSIMLNELEEVKKHKEQLDALRATLGFTANKRL